MTRDVYSGLDAECFAALLRYDPMSGRFIWRVGRGPAKAGDPAGTMDGDGYVRITIKKRMFAAHRLAWLLVHGQWPTGDIDHMNGVRTDNRIANLRDVTRSTNLENQRRARSTNKTSGLLGSSWDKKAGRWVARITVGNRHEFLGNFDTAEAAHAAYLARKRDAHRGCTI